MQVEAIINFLIATHARKSKIFIEMIKERFRIVGYVYRVQVEKKGLGSKIQLHFFKKKEKSKTNKTKC